MTTQQQLFNRFIEQNYNKLFCKFPQRDMLHSAYIIVFSTHRQFTPTAYNYERLLERAYHQSLMREMQYYKQCLLPDPLFWLYQQEQINDDNDDEKQESEMMGMAEFIDDEMKSLTEYVRTHCTKEQTIIFSLALLQQYTIEQIAEIVGKTKSEVRKSLQHIEQLLRQRQINKQTRKQK